MLPKINQKFDAYLLLHGTLTKHRCSPFTCTRRDPANIYAEDEDGDKFIFRKSSFVFKAVKERKENDL